MPVMSHEESLRVIEGVNNIIKNSGIDTNKVSDGYHTFGELYEHRITLFIQLCKWLPFDRDVWKSKKHSDGSSYDGWFLVGIGKDEGEQITYHLPISKWAECAEFPELDNAPIFDGHTSNDVLKRLKQL